LIARLLGVLVLAAVAAGLAFVAAGRGTAWSPLAVPTTHSGAPQQGARLPAPPHGALLVRRTQLRARPGGRVLRTVATKTSWGSRAMFAVVQRRGRWLGILSPYVRNSRVGWIPADNARLVHEPYTLHVDVSDRMLVVRHEGRLARRVPIAVGRRGVTTPLGRFAITDLLRFRQPGAYGCCALVLTARQPNVPQGWTGGDRIAIHGTPNEAAVGSAVTAGCMRATGEDMRWLIGHMRLGGPVQVRA
jgi:hypothetical protein